MKRNNLDFSMCILLKYESKISHGVVVVVDREWQVPLKGIR